MMMNNKITVVGLGSGDPDHLTLGVWKRLSSGVPLFLRTDQHPAVQLLHEQNIRFQSFDHLYESYDNFPEVYTAIVDALMQAAKSTENNSVEDSPTLKNGKNVDYNVSAETSKTIQGNEIIYAVPGHPMVAEYTVKLLQQHCAMEGLELEVLGGESFLDQLFTSFSIDPIEGFQLMDAAQLDSRQVSLAQHTIIGQVYDQFTASEVKLNLMRIYPDDFIVFVGHQLGVEGKEQIRSVPLYELDRVQGYGNQSVIWIPPTLEARIYNRTFEQLHQIIRVLRSPEGCPWDREQNHRSIRKNFIEEVYEVLETIDEDDPVSMCEELGDVLLQIMLHAQMEEESGAFDIYDVIADLNEKLIRRHPHVFGEEAAKDAEEALHNWAEIKREEKMAKGMDPDSVSVLSGVPRELPGLLKALMLQKKAAAVGFDWEHPEEVAAKVMEEWEEFKEAGPLSPGTAATEEQRAELGDLLFAIVNLARFLRIDPEEAISLTNLKFIKRFSYIEQQLRLKGLPIEQTGLQEMEKLWQQSKKL